MATVQNDACHRRQARSGDAAHARHDHGPQAAAGDLLILYVEGAIGSAVVPTGVVTSRHHVSATQPVRLRARGPDLEAPE